MVWPKGAVASYSTDREKQMDAAERQITRAAKDISDQVRLAVMDADEGYNAGATARFLAIIEFAQRAIEELEQGRRSAVDYRDRPY